MPAPVIVMKDVGGLVSDYQSQTELYRASDREVRLHECRSACTLALSLPNVCVYPDSTLKFHLAYDIRNHQTDANISQQLFDSYPAAVRARLGGLTREYKVLRGSELIALGVRDCTEQRVMIASSAARRASSTRIETAAPPAEQGSILGGLMRNMASVFGGFGGQADQAREKTAIARPGSVAKPASSDALAIEPPLPPSRPVEIAALREAASAEAAPESDAVEAAETQATDAPLPPRRPIRLTLSYQHKAAQVALPAIITGAQPILPTGFTAYAAFGR